MHDKWRLINLTLWGKICIIKMVIIKMISMMISMMTHKILGISQYKQSYSSIWNNPSICIAKNLFSWQTWVVKGIQVVNNLYREQLFVI